MSSNFALLQLDGMPGPVHNGKYRDAFKLEFAFVDLQGVNSGPHQVGVVRELDVSVTVLVDRFTLPFYAAYQRGNWFKRAVVVFVTSGARGALQERARVAITDVSLNSVSLGFNNSDGGQTMTIALHGTKAINK